MKSKALETFLYTAGGVVAVFVILAALNAVFGAVRLQADLTENRINTLSDASRDIMRNLEAPVTLRFYVSQSENAMPVDLRPFAGRVEDLLDAYRQANSGRVEVLKIDPEPDTEAEDSARLDGIEARLNESGQPVYLGLSFTSVDRKTALPFLSPQRERQLEYDITRAISEVTQPSRPVVGVMTSLPMMGAGMDMMMMGQPQRPSWLVMQELERLFEVREIGMGAEKIPEEVRTLVVVHPTGLTPAAEFAIDQFILRGGRLIAFLDPFSFLQSMQQRNPMMMQQPPQGSTLPELLDAWGLTLELDKVVADATFRTALDRGSGREDMLAVLSLGQEAANADDIVTGELENLLLPMPGALTGKPAEGLSMDVLLSSSEEAELVETFRAQMGGNNLIESFRPSGTRYNLAVRLTGKFKTAFPDGNPAKPAAEEETAEEAGSEDAETEAADGADSEAASPTEEAGPEALKEGAEENSVILVADSDLLYDEFLSTRRNLFGQEIVIPINENLDFALNAIEQMSGDSRLIAIRSRGETSRPFTVIRDLENKAEERFRERVAEFEAELNDVRAKLQDLNQAKQPGEQQIILSPEVQEQLVELQRKEAELNKTVRDLRRQLRRDVEVLEARIKWFNIVGMPLLVIAAGAVVIAIRKGRTAAS